MAEACECANGNVVGTKIVDLCWLLHLFVVFRVINGIQRLTTL